MSDRELHRHGRIGWLRAAVLGANDGIVSTASLVLGVASSGATSSAILIAGGAALVAGAMSMAAGEYVSVSSQSDAEAADRSLERRELSNDPAAELDELTDIYVGRGLEPALARQVAEQLTARDALTAHLRDELGQTPESLARPIQAAIASAAAFAAGAVIPLTATWLLPSNNVVWGVAGVSLGSLAVLGALAARAGGTGLWRPTLRVTFWGALAMALTSAVGAAFGTAA